MGAEYAMAKNFRILQERMSPERQAQAKAKAEELMAEMALDDLRRARNLTQERLAKALRVNQAAVSKIERRTDMYLSTLENVIRAMGGILEIRAIFPDAVVRINQFRSIGKTAKAKRNSRHARVD